MTPLMFEYEIIQRAKSDRKHIVLPEGTEERILRAAEILRMRKVVDITLIGNEEEVRNKAAALGTSVKMSSDGNLIVSGGPNDNAGVGAIWMFEKVSGIWKQVEKITVTSESGAALVGSSVDLSSTASAMVVGGPQDTAVGGATWTFG